MKQILALLIFAFTLIGCSDSDPKTDPEPENSTIDTRLLGKWKVEYSKTIQPAIYNKETGKPEYLEDAAIYEYFGDYDGIANIIPTSGMLDKLEVDIEVKENNTLIVSSVGKSDNIVLYKIEDNYLKWQGASSRTINVIKYYFEGNLLVMEYIEIETSGINADRYTISKYSEIK